jgi:hypothetical protein
MHNDNWTEETIPSRRARPGHGEAGDDLRSGGATISALVRMLGCVVVLLTLMVCGLWALYLLRGRAASGFPTPTPIIWTPTSVPTPAAAPTPSPTDTAEPTPTISPDIAIGRYVRVAGTGGYGLSLRSGPGESYTRVDVALEGEVFIVVDGPTVSGGSEWWQIRGYENEEREWWAVGNFLEPVEHP